MARSGLSIRIFGSRDDMTDFIVRQWRETAEEAISRKGFFAAALSGGSTPGDFYRSLASLKDNFPWDRTHIFLADERFVPFSDKDSNFGMMDRLFLGRVKLPKENVHAIITDASSPSEAAELYEKELKRFFNLSGKELPIFDFIGLGIGEDGHTASLFPGSPEAEVPLVPEKIRLVVSVEREYIKYARISLTFPVINNSDNVVFIVAGKNKTTIVKRVVADRDQGFPAARVEPSRGRLLYVLDSEAASMLDK